MHRPNKGSTAIFDLADHVLGLHKVRRGTEQEVDDDEDSNYYRFGTKEKTRYEPHHIFLELIKMKVSYLPRILTLKKWKK